MIWLQSLELDPWRFHLSERRGEADYVAEVMAQR
jgi:hypothetical protein